MDYTDKGKDKAKEVPKDEKNIEKVTTGKVVTRKQPLGKHIKEVFFGGEVQSVINYVAAEVLLPALRDLVVDVTSKGVQKMVYGDSKVQSRRDVTYGPRRSYYNYNQGPIDTRGREVRTPARRANVPDQPSRPRSRRNGMEIILSSKEEADRVLEQLYLILEKYEFTTVADLHELVGLPTSHVDQSHGWETLHDVEIRQVREGFLLDLPDSESI